MQTVVNGELLEGTQVEEEFSQIKSWHEQQSQVSCCERDEEFREQARQNVIGRLLLQQAAEKLDWEPTQGSCDRGDCQAPPGLRGRRGVSCFGRHGRGTRSIAAGSDGWES